jgi:hypothetical protein
MPGARCASILAVTRRPNRKHYWRLRRSMSRDNRRKPRKSLKAAAFIYTIDGRPISACSMLDVSESGAKIISSTPEDLPPEFLLSLSRDGRVRRRCQLKWRDGSKIGVQFTLDK